MTTNLAKWSQQELYAKLVEVYGSQYEVCIGRYLCNSTKPSPLGQDYTVASVSFKNNTSQGARCYLYKFETFEQLTADIEDQLKVWLKVRAFA